MAGAVSDLVRTLEMGQLVLKERQRITAEEKQWVVQETPGACNSRPGDLPSSVSSCGKVVGRPCIANLSKKLNFGKKGKKKKRNSQVVQNGF